MIAIYSLDHLARALWTDAEETFRRGEEHEGRTYRTVEWEQAHDLDRAEYMVRAERVSRLCQAQANDLLRRPHRTGV